MHKETKQVSIFLLFLGLFTLPRAETGDAFHFLEEESAPPDRVIVVLSSPSGPYEEALAGFRESFGGPARVIVLSEGVPQVPKSTRLIVAIGGKAAVYPYESRKVPLIYCLAPGIYVDSQIHSGRRVKVFVSPAPESLLKKLQELQPALKRLGVVWVNASVIGYGKELETVGARMGVKVLRERLISVDGLPVWLRSIKGRFDALWLPPDPLLITPQSFALVREFCWANDIPLYVSMATLADKGAAASVSASFRDMGRKAGALAVQALSGTLENSASFYADEVSVTINAAASAETGLKLSKAICKSADRILK